MSRFHTSTCTQTANSVNLLRIRTNSSSSKWFLIKTMYFLSFCWNNSKKEISGCANRRTCRFFRSARSHTKHTRSAHRIEDSTTSSLWFNSSSTSTTWTSLSNLNTRCWSFHSDFKTPKIIIYLPIHMLHIYVCGACYSLLFCTIFTRISCTLFHIGLPDFDSLKLNGRQNLFFYILPTKLD